MLRKRAPTQDRESCVPLCAADQGFGSAAHSAAVLKVEMLNSYHAAARNSHKDDVSSAQSMQYDWNHERLTCGRVATLCQGFARGG